MRDDILKAEAFDYSQIVPGMFMRATIKDVASKGILLKVNSFVEGVLPLDHMAEMPVKTIPPKFAVGKEIKVRVFSVDPLSRQITFTKKDTLMKEKTPTHDGAVENIQAAEKVYGVAVAQTEHGWVVRSFGNIKGLLTFAELDNTKIREGSIVKGYVLFNKKKSGLALTLDKKKCKKANKSTEALSFENYLPDEETSKQLKKTYKTLLSKQNGDKMIGKSFTFKISEEMTHFYVVKSIKTETQSKRIVAIVPKCLASTCAISVPLHRPDV